MYKILSRASSIYKKENTKNNILYFQTLWTVGIFQTLETCGAGNANQTICMSMWPCQHRGSQVSGIRVQKTLISNLTFPLCKSPKFKEVNSHANAQVSSRKLMWRRCSVKLKRTKARQTSCLYFLHRSVGFSGGFSLTQQSGVDANLAVLPPCHLHVSSPATIVPDSSKSAHSQEVRSVNAIWTPCLVELQTLCSCESLQPHFISKVPWDRREDTVSISLSLPLGFSAHFLLILLEHMAQGTPAVLSRKKLGPQLWRIGDSLMLFMHYGQKKKKRKKSSFFEFL